MSEHLPKAPDGSAPEAWLGRRGVEPGDTTRLTMTRREFDLLRDVGLGNSGGTTSFLIGKTRENYGIQSDAQYASVDIVPDDASLPHAAKLVDIREEDFGTVIDEGRPESRGEDVPRITMKEREFNLFRIAGMDRSNVSSLVEYARDLCGVPRDDQDDQYAPKYALIDIESEDPTPPSVPLLVDMTEADFGTTIDVDSGDEYFQTPGPDPDSPLTPESGGAYRTVDITEALAKSAQGLQAFAIELMKGTTTNPLSGSFWVRAGGVAAGQRDAFVWENGRPFTRAVELTTAFPGQYRSVCVVVGDRQDPINGKPGMAQIKDPTVVLTIAGENLTRLQEIYGRLYHEPGFALTDEQRRQRDETFNDYVVRLISHETERNRAREQAQRDEERRRRAQRQPQVRARPLPGSSDPYRRY